LNEITKVIAIAVLVGVVIGFFGVFVWAGREVIRDAAGDHRRMALGIAGVA
jgi:hypothetical protein